MHGPEENPLHRLVAYRARRSAAWATGRRDRERSSSQFCSQQRRASQGAAPPWSRKARCRRHRRPTGACRGLGPWLVLSYQELAPQGCLDRQSRDG
jgi:hypothetical protein